MLRRLGYKTKVVRGVASEAPAAAKKAVLQLIRWDPETNHQRIETYEYTKKQDYMVLDLLISVKAHQDPSLAYRASCCEGVCGSCAMNINGINSLACITFAKDVTTVGPLPNFPVIKDMVVDMRGFFKQYEYIRPFVRNVNLKRFHVDNIQKRYSALCRAVFGRPVLDRDPVATAGGHESAELSMYAQLLDRVVAIGDVVKTIEVLKKVRKCGYTVDSAKATALIAKALANHKK